MLIGTEFFMSIFHYAESGPGQRHDPQCLFVPGRRDIHPYRPSRRLEHESELALLLAHEIIHITRQHTLQVAMLPQREGGGSFAGREQSDSLSWFRDMAMDQGDAGPVDTVQDLRRKLEQEADRAGLDMLIKSNYAFQ